MFPLLEEAGACPVCASSHLRPLHVYAAKKRAIAASPNLAMIGCEGCGVVFSHPLPSERQLEEYYAANYWDERLPRVAPGRDEKLRRHADQLRLLQPHLSLPESPRGQPPRAFDYGCGRGEWLDVLADAGWATSGLEPGGPAREFAAERHTVVDDLPAEETYDLVVLNHVLEHLRDPLGVMRRVVAATRPGGYVFVSVPDLGRLPEHGRFSYVKSGVHIMSYTFSAMKSLMSLAGLEVVGHFDGPEWDAVLAPEAGRLKCLGRRTDRVASIEGHPLDEAVESLRAYGREGECETGAGAVARRPAAGGRGTARRLLGRLAGR
ncbi:MAG: class I SAM-dependent methyltransferase [Thermoleophilaceae bacterium]